MKRLLIAGLTLVVFAASPICYGYVLTEDIPNLIQNIENYVRQGLQYASQLATQYSSNTTALKEIQQVQNELQQLERMGDPANIRNLAGVSDIATLVAMYQQAVLDVQHLDELIDPTHAVTNCNSIVEHYSLPGFSPITSQLGLMTSAPVGSVQFFNSNYNTNQFTQETIQSLIAKKQTYSQQRDQAIAALQAATDQSTVQKQDAIISALTASIAGVDASIAQAMQSGSLQVGMNNSAQAIYAQLQGVQGSATFQNGLENLATGGGTTTNASEFGAVDNPAMGGSGDPGTTGSWDVGAFGSPIGNPNTQGVALPASVLIAQFGSTAAANGQFVQLTNPATGATSVQPIVDIGPGNNSQANGFGIDLLPATASQIGVNSGSPVSYKFISGLPGGTIATTIGQ